ncbi:hypothetical protein O7626_05890 [Micromonospora sp. WMMD1102]|uniref:hypothetical protein n=1 Tax=Micromonospora sp. WMMD1102 TaxID=3016105 RepID=UPI002414E148|nr:hypothetical protein [Micromonospora sp. WMMD1102]MDG4785468.1 hypothetical protein [Micromonospora sp. WMMD1102]
MSLVLEEGKPGWAAGRFVHASGQPFLAPTDEDADGSVGVPLIFDGARPDIAEVGNRWVTVTGVLRDQRLHVSTLALGGAGSASPAAAEMTGRGDNSARQSRSVEQKAPAEREFQLDRRLPAETLLIERGLLVDAWTEEATGRRIALATDPEPVRDALQPHYPNSIEVVPSRWDLRYLDGIRSQVPDEILLAFGNSVGKIHQLRLAMTLLHLPAAVARRLAGYPADALDVRVLVQPAPGTG